MPDIKNQAVDTAREDPLLTYHFGIEVSGKAKGYFTSISGLGSSTTVIEHKTVNEKGVEVVMKVPGRHEWEDITLSRGLTSNMDLWKWRQEVEDGGVDKARADGTITMYDQSLKAIAKWDFKNGWPCALAGPSLNSESDAISIEGLTITHEGIWRKQ